MELRDKILSFKERLGMRLNLHPDDRANMTIPQLIEVSFKCRYPTRFDDDLCAAIEIIHELLMKIAIITHDER